MAIFKKSENDVHGFVPYSIGLAAIIVTCTCVAGASVLSQVAQNGKGPVFAFLAPKSVPDTTTVTAQKKPVARIDLARQRPSAMAEPRTFCSSR